MKLSELKGKEVLSTDGRTIGTIEGAILKGKWNVNSISIKVEKNAIDALGKKKPMLFSLRQDVNVDYIKAIDDKVILEKDLKSLGIYLSDHDEELSASRIVGLEVVDPNGNVIGKADDLILHCVMKCSEWEMPSLIVNVDKEAVHDINLKKALFSTPNIQINMKHVKDIGDAIMLKIDAKELTTLIEQSDVKVA